MPRDALIEERKSDDAVRSVALVGEACRLIDEAEERPQLADVAAAVGASPWELTRAFRKALGITPSAYADWRRSHRFRAELRRGESVAGATYGAGYGSSSRVYEGAAKRLGMTPASYAKGGQGAEIAWSITPSPLGLLLVAATAKGVCFLALGEDEATLEEELKAEFPAARRLQRDDEWMSASVACVLDYLEGRLPHPSLPLDVRFTAFQRQVWDELMAIPPGETRTYSEIAQKLGLPKAQRAVGRACATNPVSLVIPCHRVLREDGALGGYRWGLSRKARLIAAERLIADEEQEEGRSSAA